MAHWGLVLVTPPAAEPLSLEQAKGHLRVEVDDDDALISSLLQAAREKFEHDTWRALLTQTYDFVLDSFPPCNEAIRLPRPPLQSVTSVKYLDADGVQQTLAASVYKVDTASEPGRLLLKEGEVWPDTLAEGNAVEVRYVAGYGDAPKAVPAMAMTALKMLLSHWYEHREAVVVGGAVPQELRLAWSSVVDSNKVRSSYP